MKFDMHCHTKEGSPDGSIRVEDTIRILQEKGFDGMLISDHNSYRAYRHWKKNIKVLRTGADRDPCPGGKVPQYFCILLHVPRNNIIQPVQSAVDPDPENYPQ